MLVGSIRPIETRTVDVQAATLEDVHTALEQQRPAGFDLVSAPVISQVEEHLHLVELLRGEVAPGEDRLIEHAHERAALVDDPHSPGHGADAGDLVHT